MQIAISLKPSHNDVHWPLWLTDANTSNFRHIGQLRNCFIADSGVNVTPFKLDISLCHRLHDFAHSQHGLTYPHGGAVTEPIKQI